MYVGAKFLLLLENIHMMNIKGEDTWSFQKFNNFLSSGSTDNLLRNIKILRKLSSKFKAMGKSLALPYISQDSFKFFGLSILIFLKLP